MVDRVGHRRPLLLPEVHVRHLDPAVKIGARSVPGATPLRHEPAVRRGGWVP
jgi:hypothetical protein